MTRKETAAMLGMFKLYWPSFLVAPAGDDTPGTIDAWSELLGPYTQNECAAVLKEFRCERARAFAPTASEFLGEILEQQKFRARDKAFLEQQRRLSAPGEGKLASPEVAARFLAELHAAVAKIAKSKSIPTEHTGPVLDENYDWKGTFAKLEEAQRLAK